MCDLASHEIRDGSQKLTVGFMAELVAPHGGLSEPVCCTVGAGDVAAFNAEAAGLVKVPVSQADLSSVYRFADGTLSPLKGPMTSAVYNRVLNESVIENNGQLYAWTIPLALPVTAAQATLDVGLAVDQRGGAGVPARALHVGLARQRVRAHVEQVAIRVAGVGGLGAVPVVAAGDEDVRRRRGCSFGCFAWL